MSTPSPEENLTTAGQHLPSGSSSPDNAHASMAGAKKVVANAIDPARRPDVFFRVRRPEGSEPSVWWMIGAFLAVSTAVIILMVFVPGGT